MGKIPCEYALSNSDCPFMKSKYERLGKAYSITGDIKCVGIGNPGCELGLSENSLKRYKWAYRAGFA
ncbi:MAG: hypothetical protein QW076_05355 [Candidatus Anstonellales archaeon]